MRAVKVTSIATGASGTSCDAQVHAAERLDDVDRDGPDGHRVRIAVEGSRVARVLERAADPAELQRVDLLARGERREREDHRVAQVVARVHHEEEAVAPMLVVGHDIGERLGDLVDEEFVHRRQAGHRPPLGRGFASRDASGGNQSAGVTPVICAPEPHP